MSQPLFRLSLYFWPWRTRFSVRVEEYLSDSGQAIILRDHYDGHLSRSMPFASRVAKMQKLESICDFAGWVLLLSCLCHSSKTN